MLLRFERLEDRCLPNAAPGLQFLRLMHDEYHTRLAVYDDVSSAGNHFPAIAAIPSANAPVSLNGSWTVNPHSGATAIRNQFTANTGQPFGGIYFQNGLLSGTGTVPNFGDTPNAGVRITDPVRITFWARGEVGGEQLEFFAFGVGRDAQTGVPTNPHPDSAPRTPALGTFTTLTTDWRQYSIDVSGKDTSYVLGGFAWVAEQTRNPSGAVFYLDDIQYELTAAGVSARSNEPHFARSYLTGPSQSVSGPAADFDFVLRNSAFSYDNALTALAFLADRDPATQADSVRRARLIGDTFVYAAGHDRKYTDGRVRDVYSAGDRAVPPGWVVNGQTGTAPVAGFFSEQQQQFFEILQLNVDTGNNAWVMVALLALHARTGEASYLAAARRVGDFILTMRQDTGTYRGFVGGIDNADHLTLSPTRRVYASSEHNIDIYAAFTRMFQLTGEAKWRDGADHAWAFVEAMWDPSIGLYRTGTADPETVNTTPGQLPLDVQAWAILARPEFVLAAHPDLLATVEQTFGVTEGGIAGVDFNNDRDGVWSEGTAQMGVAYAVAGKLARALDVRASLDQIRVTATSPGTPDLASHLGLPGGAADDLGLPAALHDGLSTGFGFQYHNRLHTGATSWNVFAQLGFNPYYQTYAGGAELVVGGTADGRVLGYAVAPSGVFLTPPAVDLAPFGKLATSVRATAADVNGDGVPDVVVVTGPGTPIRVAVVNGRNTGGFLVAPFDPFGGDFLGGGFVSAGDIDGDGKFEFAVTPDEGGGPRVTIFSLANGTAPRQNFFGIDDPNFRGGARAALGDVNGDQTPDLAVCAGFLGGPRTALFDGKTLFSTPKKLLNDFFAFPGSDAETLRNGVFVASGDVDGDGFAELIFGGGPGGAPRVFILSGALVSAGDVGGAQSSPVGNFFVPGNAADRGGVRLAVKDADGDAKLDVVAGSGEGSPSRVRVYLGKNFSGASEPAAFQDLDPFAAALPGGVFVG
jgi:hypothetical protein